jgi:hypothetical protein
MRSKGVRLGRREPYHPSRPCSRSDRDHGHGGLIPMDRTRVGIRVSRPRPAPGGAVMDQARHYAGTDRVRQAAAERPPRAHAPDAEGGACAPPRVNPSPTETAPPTCSARHGFGTPRAGSTGAILCRPPFRGREGLRCATRQPPANAVVRIVCITWQARAPIAQSRCIPPRIADGVSPSES